MKNIGVFFKQPGAKDYPFNKDEYWHAYQELDQEIKNLGGRFYIVRHQSTYGGQGHFSQSWQFQDGALVESGPITLEVLYDKGEFISDESIPVLNRKEINDICTDKSQTYKLFQDFCPKTIRVESEEDFSKALESIPGERKVIKPIDEEEGNGVFIGADDYLKKCPYSLPMLVQEFIDSSEGIPGIVEGIHDFRVAILNGDIVFTFVRTPPPGELLANISQGGNAIVLTPQEIPPKALDVVKVVEAHMQQYDLRFYGIDMAFSHGKFYIIELNSRLGLQENKRHEVFVELKRKLAEIFIQTS